MKVPRRGVWRWLIPFTLFAAVVLIIFSRIGEARGVDGFRLRKDFDLKNGEQIEGDQVIVAASVSLHEGSAVEGKVTLIGNEVSVDGSIAGNAVIVANNLRLGSTASIAGDLVVCADELARSNSARISGELKEECRESRRVSVSNIFESAYDSWRNSFLVRLSSMIAGALVFGAFAALGTVLIPGPLFRMSRTVWQAPLTTGGLGCLTMVVAFGLTALYLFSLLLLLPLVLLPFILVGWLALLLASLLGWMAMAEPVGGFLLRVLHIDEQPRMITAAVGGVALTLLVRIWALFWFTTWIGLIVTIILGSMGLGAVILTRIGTQPFPHGATRLAGGDAPGD